MEIDYLYHYYEYKIGPFVNLSDLPLDKAKKIQDDIHHEGAVSADKRKGDYLIIRRKLEDKLRSLFIEKGGNPVRERPHYMTLGPCPWLKEMYVEGCELSIPINYFNPDILSFTYGDTFPAMRHKDGKPYRGKVFLLDEIQDIINIYGLPQIWNSDGSKGPDRYIEAQIWDDEPIKQYLKDKSDSH